MKLTAHITCLAALACGAVCLTVAGEPTLPASRELVSPAGPDTGESNLYRGPDGTLYLTWAAPGDREGERALRLATLAPEASTWSAPRTIISTPLLMENWADFASLIVGTDGAWVAQWFQRQPGEDSHGYDGWFARSTDEGMSWSKPAPLGHEFVSLAPLSGGRTLAVWLESTRVRDPGTPRIKHDPTLPRPPHDPQMPSVPAMRLSARLLAADGTPLRDWIIDPDVCTCCQTSLARLPGDRAIVTYRGHTADEIRDNRVAHFDGTEWSTATPLHADGWKIPGCPVNGPAVDALGERVAITWFTAAEGVARVQAKLSVDGGRTFGPAIALDLGRPIGRVDLVALADGSSLVSWMEARTEQNAAGLYVRRIFPDGGVSAPYLAAATSSARTSGFARLAARNGPALPVVISWTETVAGSATTPATQVRTVEFPASRLTRIPRATAARLDDPTRHVAVVRGNAIEFLELCAAPARKGHVAPPEAFPPGSPSQ